MSICDELKSNDEMLSLLSYDCIDRYPYYTGYRVCVTPLDIVDASPGFYTEPYDFGFAGRGA